MARRVAEFFLGHLGAAGNAPRYAGPAPLSHDYSEDRFAGNYGLRLAANGETNK